MGDSFAERLRRLEDAEQIRQLNLAYRRHLDTRDLDAYGRLFADDGVRKLFLKARDGEAVAPDAAASVRGANRYVLSALQTLEAMAFRFLITALPVADIPRRALIFPCLTAACPKRLPLKRTGDTATNAT